MNRKSTDDCLLCLTEKSTKKNSHIIPAGMIKNSIGKRDYEQSYFIDAEEAEIDEYYGRSNLNNPSTEIKENHHAKDFIFCPECEKKLGELESKVLPFLMDKMRDKANVTDFESKTSRLGLPYREIKNLDGTDFQVLILSIIWRLAFVYREEKGITVFKDYEYGYLRELIYYHLYGTEEQKVEEILDFFAFNIMTIDEFDNATKNYALTGDFWDNPNVFFLFEYVVLVYTSEDAVASNPNPLLDLLNYFGEPPKVMFLTQEIWDDMLKGIVQFTAKEFLNTLGKKLSLLNGQSIDFCKHLIVVEAKKLELEEGEKKFGYYCVQAAKSLIEEVNDST